MRPISYKRHRFPPDAIRLAVWLYFRFTLSLRDVEEMLAERGIDVTYETIRCWTMKFRTAISANIRKARPRADSTAPRHRHRQWCFAHRSACPAR
jgi:transposase-like protein